MDFNIKFHFTDHIEGITQCGPFTRGVEMSVFVNRKKFRQLTTIERHFILTHECQHAIASYLGG